jgi:hypothetical protein
VALLWVPMTYTAIYQDPWDQDGKTEEGTVVTHTVNLRISSNMALTDEQVREILRRHLRERFKLTDINEDKIRIE